MSLALLLGVRPGDRPPAKEVGTCQVCHLQIREDQYRVMGLWHEACLARVSDDKDGTTYRTPQGGTIRIGKGGTKKGPAHRVRPAATS